MQVLVSDTSILVDLERGSLLQAAFALPSCGFAVPDLLYERELKDHGGTELLALGLRVEALSDEGVVEAGGYRRAKPFLSVPDSFALALARANGWVLLTGDGLLRDLAGSHAVECHGVLWMLDRMVAEAAATAQAAHAGLGAIAAHPRCRLPKEEITLRLARYAAASTRTSPP